MNDKETGFGIIIVAHGRLAHEFLATLEHVIGKKDRIAAISIEDADDKTAKREDIQKLAEAFDNGSGVVMVTDMFGGTPSNLALTPCASDKRKLLYGVNMPALIKLARMRNHPLDEAIEAAVKAGHQYLNFCDKKGHS